MKPQPFVELLLDNESLTDGIGDAEAKLLMDWALSAVEAEVARLDDREEALDVTAAVGKRCRRLAKVAEALCYDEDLPKAQAAMASLGHAHDLAPWLSAEPSAFVRQLLEWEKQIEG
jgi:hypothetical protein